MTIVRRLTILAFLSFGSSWALAQPGNPSGDPDVVPITGLEYLLIAGGAYGVSRLVRKKKDKSTDADL